jgi:hypothetical protein
MEMPALINRRNKVQWLLALCIFIYLEALNGCGAQTQTNGESMTNSNGKLIQGVYVTWLIDEIRPQYSFLERSFTGEGFEYRYQTLPDKPSIDMRVSVYPTEAGAEAAMRNQKRLMSIGPYPTDEQVGDQLLMWKLEGSNSGSLAFRRANAMIYLAGGEDINELLELSKDIDSAMTTPKKAVEWRDSLKLPEIINVNWPEKIYVGDQLTLDVELKGVALSEAHLASSNTNIIATTKPNPQITYFAPGEAGIDDVVLVIGTEGCLITGQQFAINVLAKDN